jgi:ribosomal protein S18 acetylase RimI-like enzyme
MNNIVILPLTEVDEALLAEMVYQAIFVPAGAEPPLRAIVEEPGLRKYYAAFGIQPGDIGYKAVDSQSDQAVGAAWVRLFTGEAQGYGYVDDATPELSIAVEPAYRGQGIGEHLLQQLFAAVAAHYRAVSLSVWPENPAYRLYQRLGFTIVKTDEGSPAVTMVKALA